MTRAAKAEAALRKQKDARQKKILIFLAPVFLALVAWQGPGMLKAFSGSPPPPPPPPAAPAPKPGTPAAADPAAGGAPSTAAPGTAVPTSSATLQNTDEPLPAGEGELVSFDRFVGKDPFRQQVSDESGSGGGGGDGSGGGSGGGADNAKSGGGGSGTDNPSPLTTPPDDDDGDDGGGSGGDGDAVATIEVNGTVEVVSVEGAFPANEPIFRLVSLRRSSAKIGLVTGEFSTQSPTITLRVGKPLTLVSQPDGLRYTVTLRRVG